MYDCDRIKPKPDVASTMRVIVRRAWKDIETDRKCLRNTGKRPNTCIENRVSENTAVVVKSRDASTVLAIRAALVLRLLGNGGAREDMLGGVNDGSTGVENEGPLEMTVCDWGRDRDDVFELEAVVP